MMINLTDVKQARERISGMIHRTSHVSSKTLSKRCGSEIYLKPENLQKTGAFKIRGALNAVMDLERSTALKGIITASSGNHGQAVAMAGSMAGYPAIVVMPEDASSAKVQAIRGYGAEVIFQGTTSRERIEKAEELCSQKDLTFIHPFNDPLVMAGQGTIGLEILEDLPEVQQVLAPIGGGGLISGISTAIKEIRPDVKVFGVEPEQSNSMYMSIQNKKRTERKDIVSVADGLRTSIPGTLTFPTVQKYVDDILLVSEKDIIRAMLLILERCKLLSEPSGAVTVAAMISGKLPEKGRKTVAVISGGNIALSNLAEMISDTDKIQL